MIYQFYLYTETEPSEPITANHVIFCCHFNSFGSVSGPNSTVVLKLPCFSIVVIFVFRLLSRGSAGHVGSCGTNHAPFWHLTDRTCCAGCERGFSDKSEDPESGSQHKTLRSERISLTWFDVRPPGEPGTWRRRWRVARWDKSRFHSGWIRKITSLDRVRTLVTPLLQLRRSHRTILVAVRRSSAQSVREEGEERMRDRERVVAEG